MKEETEAQNEKIESQKKAAEELEKLKIEKLMNNFEQKFSQNPAFSDVFTDSEVYKQLMATEDYKKISEMLMTYVLHSANQKKPRKKKAEGAQNRRRRF